MSYLKDLLKKTLGKDVPDKPEEMSRAQKIIAAKVAVAEAVLKIEELCGGLKGLAKKFNDMAYESFCAKQDAYAREALQAECEIEEIERFFKFITIKLKGKVYEAQLFDNFDQLIQTTTNCQNVLCDHIDVDDLVKKFGELFNSNDNPFDKIKNLMKIATTKIVSGVDDSAETKIARVFGEFEKPVADEQKNHRIDDKLKSLQDRWMMEHGKDVNPAPAETANNKAKSNDGDITIDDIAGVLDSERKN